MVLFRFFYIQALLIKYKLRPFSDVQIRETLIKLGPLFIKFGQALSTRRDLLSESLAHELSKLQDKVPCFPTDIAINIIESTFKQPVHTVFKSFNPVPLAGASIAQVYGAQLPTGESVVIKVLRPHIDKIIKKDLKLLFFFARCLHKIPKYKRYKFIEIVKELQKTILLELNLMNEAANASLLKRHFLNSPLLYIPKIYWDYARPHLIVMERIEGIPISDTKALKAAGITLKKLAERGVEIFLTQVFQQGFFHADMHPGNIFVSEQNPYNPQYLAVDFGIMGSLTPEDQNYLAQNFLAFFKRDYRAIAQLYIASGWISADSKITEFEAAVRTVCEPIFEKPLKDISLAASLLTLFQTAQRFNMEVQPQLLLLQKTLVNIEGLGKHLYPDLNLWQTAQPFLEKWLKAQMGPAVRFKLLLETLKRQVPQWLDHVLDSI